MLNSPIGQLVGGKSDRYVKYADTNNPTKADAIIAHKRLVLFIAVRPLRHSRDYCVRPHVQAYISLASRALGLVDRFIGLIPQALS